MNGRLLKVRKDDPRYEDEDNAAMTGGVARYVHRKPSARAKQVYAVGETLGNNSVARGLLDSPTARTVVGTAVATQAPRIIRAIPKAIRAATGARMAVGAGIAEGATVGGLGVVAFLAAAGLASYFGTRYIIDNFPTKARRLAAASDAYRKSRVDLATSLGRNLNAAELKSLSDHYKQVVKDINAYPF